MKILPKVSIIVPVYNVRDYICRCVNSVLNQTYTNIELILIDDYDMQNSLDVVSTTLMDSYFDYKIVKHSENKGLSIARNTGISVSTGDYLFFLDSDDELPHNAIELLVNKAIETNSEVIMGALSWIENMKNNYYTNGNVNIRGNKNIIEFIRTHSVLLIGCNKLIKRNFIIKNDLYFHPNILHEDLLYSFLLFSYLNSISFIENVTYLYYVRNNSITTQSFNEKKIDSFVEMMKVMRSVILKMKNNDLYALYKSRCFSMLEITATSKNSNYIELIQKNALKDIGRNILSSYTSLKDIFKTIPFYISASLVHIYLNLIKLGR